MCLRVRAANLDCCVRSFRSGHTNPKETGTVQGPKDMHGRHQGASLTEGPRAEDVNQWKATSESAGATSSVHSFPTQQSIGETGMGSHFE